MSVDITWRAKGLGYRKKKARRGVGVGYGLGDSACGGKRWRYNILHMLTSGELDHG